MVYGGKNKKRINNKLIEICEEGFPNEVCGVLIGKKDKEIFTINDYYVCENLNKERSVIVTSLILLITLKLKIMQRK